MRDSNHHNKHIKERKLAEEELRESEESFRSLVEQSPLSIQILSPDGWTLHVNHAFEELWGVTEEMLSQYNMLEDRQLEKLGIMPNIRRGFSGEANSIPAAEYDTRQTLGTGEKKWVQARMYPLKDKAGNIRKVVLIHEDITMRKRAEQALHEKERHSQSLIRLSRNMERSQTYAQVLDAARDEVRDIIGYKNVWVYILSEDKKYAHALVAGGDMEETVMSEDGTATLTIQGDPMLEEIAAAKTIVVVEDARTDPRTNKEIVARLGNRTIVNVPIIFFDKHLGSVGMGTFGDEGVRVPTSSEEEYLLALASHMAVSLDRIHLLEERKQAEKNLAERVMLAELSADIGCSLTQQPNLQSMLKECADAMVRHLDAAFARIWTLHAAENVLELQASSGMYTRIDGSHSRVPVGKLKIGMIAEERRPHITNAVVGDPLIPDQEWAKQEGMVAFAGHPLTIGNKLVGVMALFFRSPITVAALKALGAVANEIAMGIERMQNEDALKKSDAFITNILESIDEGFIVIDCDYRIKAANQAFMKLFSNRKSDVIGKFCYEISHHCDRPCYELGEDCASERTFVSGEPHRALHKHTDADGKPIYVETKAYPMKNEAGKVISVIEILVDVTEKMKLEEQLRHSQKMESLGTLAGGVAHDFNNILSVIVGCGSMMEMKTAPDDPNMHYIREVMIAAERAIHLTQSLLIFSRKQVAELKPVDINELVKGMQKMVLRIIGEDIETRVDLTPEKLAVLGDYRELEQVLVNFATNARDAMPEGGSLTVATGLVEIDEEFIHLHGFGKRGKYALISVSDTGCGMDENVRARIFEPFFTTKKAGKGTGLGLSIAYGIVQQHNGYIVCYSEPGRGTTFKVFLPTISEAVLDAENQEESPLQGGTETILIAEDDAQIRMLTKDLLEKFGYTVIEAQDGVDAVSKFLDNRDRIHLLLLDVIMPRKSGKEAVEEIRSMQPDIKVLFISGYTEDVIYRRKIIEEKFPVIQKPAKPRELLSKIREILDSRHPVVSGSSPVND